MTHKLYTIDNQFIKEADIWPHNFTGIIETSNGSKYWYFEGKYHRLDGPAYVGADGSKFWYVGGKRHRLVGPAYKNRDGSKSWYIDDKRVTEEQCKLLHSIMRLKGLS